MEDAYAKYLVESEASVIDKPAASMPTIGQLTKHYKPAGPMPSIGQLTKHVQHVAPASPAPITPPKIMPGVVTGLKSNLTKDQLTANQKYVIAHCPKSSYG